MHGLHTTSVKAPEQRQPPRGVQAGGTAPAYSGASEQSSESVAEREPACVGRQVKRLLRAHLRAPPELLGEGGHFIGLVR